MAAIHIYDAELILTTQAATPTAYNVSTYVKKVTLNINKASLIKTTMGSTAVRRKTGLSDGTLVVEYVQDYASGLLDKILYDLWNTGTAVNFSVKTSSVATSVDNPKWTGSVIPNMYTPLDTSVGDLAVVTLTWEFDSTPVRVMA